MSFSKISECRLCSSGNLTNIYNLGNLASCGIFPSQANKDQIQRLPIDLIICEECKLVQLKHNYDLDHLFRDTYGYRSGLNESMISHLQELANEVMEMVQVGPQDLVVDIGSNDGTSLGFYRNNKCQRIGVDPTATQFKVFYDQDIEIIPDFFTPELVNNYLKNKKAKVISSIAMFYDLPDPNSFVRAIKHLLHPEGIWVFEQSYLPTMLEANSFDTICHEHLEYYCLTPIKHLLEKHGLKIVDVSLNDANGGSFRVFASHADSGFKPQDSGINALLEREVENGYLTAEPISQLEKNTAQIKEQVLSFLKEAKENKKIVHGYGASTKGNTLLQLFNIGPELLPMIADRNPRKFGLFTPGTNIPIVSEEESRSQNPDFYLVLPWHFKDSFLKREDAFRKNGGKFVFPLPKFEIL